MNFIFSLPIALHISCKYLGYLLFVDTKLIVYYVGFLLLPSKVHADALSNLQYRGAKVATEMLL